MSYYQTILRPFLDANLDAILRNLGKDFDSNDFITAFRLLFPNEYATALRRSSSYRAIILGLPDGIFPAEPIYFKKAIFGRGIATTAIQQKITRGSNFNTSTIWAENS